MPNRRRIIGSCLKLTMGLPGYRRFALVCVLALGCMTLTAAESRPTQSAYKAARRSLKNVTFAFVSGGRLRMDLHYPADLTQGPFPVIIYLHAGSWMGGSKGGREIRTFLPHFLDRGYAVASIEYRLAPKAMFPAQVEDAKCCVRFIRKNGGSFMLDGDRIGAFGLSAGGHLAALMSVAQSADGFEGSGGWSDQSSRIQGAVSLFAPTDLPPLADDPRNVEIIRKVFGFSQLERASPIEYVNSGDSPCMLIHGALDSRVPVSQSQAMHEKLTAASVPAELLLVQHAGHGMEPVGGMPDPAFNEWMGSAMDFLDQHVKGAPATSDQ
jgi:acetyl esterase/lipase